MWTPAASPAVRKATAWSVPIRSTPVSWPTSSEGPLIGVSDSRLKKPVSMSWATLVPAVLVEKIAPCMKGKASANARYEVVGNPGMSVAALEPGRVDREQEQGEDEGRDDDDRLPRTCGSPTATPGSEPGCGNVAVTVASDIGC